MRFVARAGKLAGVWLAGLVLVACSLGRPAISETPNATPSATRAFTIAPIQDTGEVRETGDIIIASPLPSQTPPPASATPSPLPTLGPFEHVIQPGDTLGYIIQQYGYRSTDTYSMDQIVALNANVLNANSLPGPGSAILIPRPTATPLPIGIEMTATADAELGTTTLGGITLPAGAELICHEVRGGETIIDITAKYGMTVEIIAKLNRDIDFGGCDLTLPGGGDCTVHIAVGQCVTVPGPTPLPTRTSTPAGNEAPTPTPLPRPPLAIAPIDGARFPAAPPPMLYWVGAPLLPEEAYLVVMYDAVATLELLRLTRASALRLPLEFAPAPGEARTITWTVRVVRRREQGTYAFVSEFAPARSLRWESN